MSPLHIPASTRHAQTVASDPRASAWVDAHAGSGKTYVLTQRVIRLLLRGSAPSRLLCLTYTKAAAANMFNRVLERLSDWTRLDDAALDRALIDTDGGESSTERRAAARRLFATVLETPGGLKVQTIHAFCERVLHMFPFEAGVPAGFAVLDAQQTRELLAATRADVLIEAAAAPGEALGRALATALDAASDEGLGIALDAAVNERAALAAWYAATPDMTRHQRVARVLGLPADIQRRDVIAEILDGPHLQRAAWRTIAARLANGKTDAETKLAEALVAAASASDLEQQLACYLRRFVIGKGTLAAESRLVPKSMQRAHPDLAAAVLAEHARLGDALDRLRLVEARDRTAALLTLADAVIARYEAAKRRRGLLDFDDLVERTRALFANVPASWVLYKLDSGIDHVLIDEAQDTSPAQWAVIEALTSEFFAGRGARENAVRTVFAVGDAKQSIFGFQGAAPHMFADMQRQFADKAGTAERRFERVRLDTSFRAAQPVLDAVDTVFATSAAQPGVVVPPDQLKHDAVRDELPGVVELWPLLTPEPMPDDDWTLPVDALPEESPVLRLARNIAATVAAWLAGARCRPDGSPIRAGDVMILVRRRGPLFEAMIRALKLHHVPVAGADRLVLADHIAVMDLLALADALLLPGDDLALATLLKSPLFGFDDDDLIRLCPRRTGSLADALDASSIPRDRDAAARLARWRDEATRLRPYDFLARVLGRDGGRRAFLARLGAEAADPLDELLALALDAEARGVTTLRALAAAIRSGGAEIKRDMEMAGNAVRVMTAHGAKGLEAPIVILADTTAAPESNKPPRLLPLGNARIWVPTKPEVEPPLIAAARMQVSDLSRAEYHRLLYVALTRAAEVLVVAGAAGVRGAPAGCWYDLVTNALADAVDEPADGWPGTVRRWRRWPQTAGASPPPVSSADVVAPAWLRTPVSAFAGAARLTPSRMASAPSAIDPQRAAAMARGRLLHRLLELLPDLPPEVRDKAAVDLAIRVGRALDETVARSIAADAVALLADPRLAPLFGPQSRAEVPIVGRIPLAGGGWRPVSGRIDRLHVVDGTATLLDIKTDIDVPATVAAIAPAYLDQMATYRALLAEALPGHAIIAALLYAAGPRRLDIPPALLDAAWARITTP